MQKVIYKGSKAERRYGSVIVADARYPLGQPVLATDAQADALAALEDHEFDVTTATKTDLKRLPRADRSTDDADAEETPDGGGFGGGTPPTPPTT